MWVVDKMNLQMTEGDYGIALPITITGTTLGENDTVTIAIKRIGARTPLVESSFTSIVDNEISFSLAQADTSLLPVGRYVWTMDWFSEGSFMCNIIRAGCFEVVSKA